MRPRLPSLALAALLLAGCGGGFVIGGIDCDPELDALLRTWGSPDEVHQRIEGGLHIHTFWYWRSGAGFTFVWGTGLSCERRDFTFTPVK